MGTGQREREGASQHHQKVLMKYQGTLDGSLLSRAAPKEGGEVLMDQPKAEAHNRELKVPKSPCSSYEIWVQVTSPPHHGPILVRERSLAEGSPNFSQHVGSKSGITCLHDDSESLADNFTFAAWPHPKGRSAPKPEAGFLEEMLNITVSPVSHQAPE